MAIPMKVQPKHRLQAKAPVTRALYYIVCTVLALVFLFPIGWSILASLKPASESMQSPATFLPSHISFENYTSILNTGIVDYLLNSGFVVIVTVVLTLMLSILGGYGFSRFKFPGKDILFMVILATMMIPFQSILTPLFLLLHSLGLQNTLLGLALVYTTFQLPFAIFMMRNSFDSVPKELEEAGYIDGCSSVSVLYRVLIHVIFPGVVTVALFAIFAAWNEFLAALIFMTDSDQYTMPVYLISAQSGQYGTVDWGAIQAGMTITILPCIIVFLLLQRYYINGLIAGAIKS